MFKCPYLNLTFVKLFTYCSFVYHLSFQSILVEFGVITQVWVSEQSPDVLWIAQMIYFFICPVLFILFVISLMTFCREKPQGARPGQALDAIIIRKYAAVTEGFLLVFLFLAVWFSVFQYFIYGLVGLKQTGSKSMLRSVSIVGMTTSLTCLLLCVCRKQVIQ